MMNMEKTINERIKAVREDQGLNQKDFGLKLNLTRETINRIENGSQEPKTHLLSAICRNFHVSRGWLNTGVGEMYLSKEEISEREKEFAPSAESFELLRQERDWLRNALEAWQEALRNGFITIGGKLNGPDEPQALVVSMPDSGPGLLRIVA